jgi:uncharacterized repeat protein (TIGR03917 family)
MPENTVFPNRQPPISDAITFVGRLDGTATTVGTQPGISRGARIVVLRVASPLLDVLTAAYLVPDEAHRLAAQLSAAAVAAARHGPGRDPEPDPPRHPSGRPAGGVARHVLSAGEGTTVAELRTSLAPLPPFARLTDFSSDVEVILVFAAGEPDLPRRAAPDATPPDATPPDATPPDATPPGRAAADG